VRSLEAFVHLEQTLGVVAKATTDGLVAAVVRDATHTARLVTVVNARALRLTGAQLEGLEAQVADVVLLGHKVTVVLKGKAVVVLEAVTQPDPTRGGGLTPGALGTDGVHLLDTLLALSAEEVGLLVVR